MVIPRILVSKCLGFAHCRYNGLIIASEFVDKLKPFVEFIPVCPEMEIGLGAPRNPVRMVVINQQMCLVQPSTGKDLSGTMHDFAASFLSSAEKIDGFILKNRSPSCGIKDVKIYSGIDADYAARKNAGFFGSTVLAKFPHLPVEDEGRLTNLKIREHFLTRIFIMARFKAIKNQPSMKALVAFHSCNKLLLMSYNQNEMRILGRTVANLEKRALLQILVDYEEHLAKALLRMPRYTSNINVLMHAIGYFTYDLTKSEKAFFFKHIEKYRTSKVSLSELLGIVKSWIVRFKNDYLMSQSFFQPYPEELIEIADSGKRDKE